MRKLLMLAILVIITAALAPMASAQVTVGGHFGTVIPLVTRADGTTTTQADAYNIGFPLGVTFKGQGHFAVDLETIPFVTQNRFSHSVTFVVDPGVLYGLEHGLTVGLRAAFSVNSNQVGFIPLLNKSWKFKNEKQLFKAYFVEADFPIQFSRPPLAPATNSFTFATHFGLGF